MKLTNTPSDPLGVDTRSRNATRPPADNSSSDSGSSQFDGVLSDVGAGDKSTSADASAGAGAGAGAGAKKPDAATATASTPAALAAANDSDPAAATSLGDLFVILGKGATTDAAAKGDAKATASEDDSDGLVGSLLKRIAKDNAAGDTAASTAAALPSAVPTDVMSMLLLGSGAKNAAPSAKSDPSAGSKTTGPVLGALDPQAKSTSVATSSVTVAKETVVSDVSVSTHLAPATPLQGKTAASSGASDPTTSDTPASPAVNTAHDRVEDATAAPSHNTDLSALTAASSAMEPSFGPIRSIAAAIGDLATQPSSAATIPEATKPALGIARTMTLQMNPADLGTVGIRMHITGQTLDVQLTVSDPKTLGMVSRDRDTLATALQDQNYQLNSLVIQDGGAAASSGGNNATHQGDSSGSSARPDRQTSSGSGSDAQSGGGRQGQDTNRSTERDQRPARDPTPRVPVDSRGGALFV